MTPIGKPSTNPAAAFDFRDAVVWITGASSGIGAALAKEACRRGARTVLSARREGALNEVKRDCIDGGTPAERVLVLPLDVAEHAAMPGAVARVVDAFGRIDLLVNNAGLSQRSLCLETDLSVYRKLLDVDVLGQIALTKTVLPVMVGQGRGHLAVTASVAGKVGVPLRTGYCAAKHAMMGFFDALRTEVAHLNIRVTTIVPGSIKTEIAHNALSASGAPTGASDPFIEAGMEVGACARVIADGLAAGMEEIPVGEGREMALLDLKRTDPVGAFRTLEKVTADLLAGRPFLVG